jgi:hypothetical protein
MAQRLWAPKKEAWARSITRFANAVAITRPELVAFHAKQYWVASALRDCALPELARPGGNAGTGSPPLTGPSVAMYGSIVAGTAFVGGDMDFAVAFPSSSAVDTSASPAAHPVSFVDVHRMHHGVTLAAVYARVLEQLRATTERPFITHEANANIGDADASPQVAPSTLSAATGAGRTMLLQRIFHARVPIVQFGLLPQQVPPDATNILLRWDHNASVAAPRPILTHLRRGVKSNLYAFHSEFDVSASLCGCRNSLLLRHYAESYPVARALAMVLKYLGRRGGPAAILNAKGGWLSPYALSVMLIHYLAARGLVELVDPMTVEARMVLLTANPFDALNAEGKLDSVLAARQDFVASSGAGAGDPQSDLNFLNSVGLQSPLALPSLLESDLYGEQHSSDENSVAELLRGFFDYYAVFDYDHHIIDIRPESASRLKTRDQWNDEIRAEVAQVTKAHPDNAALQEQLLGIPPSLKAGEVTSGKPVVDRVLWHRLGYDVVMIRDPIETHSLGRGVDFFRAEAIRESFRKIAANANVDPEQLLHVPSTGAAAV